MNIGGRIRVLRTEKALTQKQLGDLCGMADSAIRRYESNRGNPTQETLQRIASALGVSVSDLLGQDKQEEPAGDWGLALEQKLAAVGCSIGTYEEDAYIWINYPDGTLEVTEEELRELDESTDSYLRFKLQELRDRHPDSFRPKRKRQERAINVEPKEKPSPTASEVLKNSGS